MNMKLPANFPLPPPRLTLMLPLMSAFTGANAVPCNMSGGETEQDNPHSRHRDLQLNLSWLTQTRAWPYLAHVHTVWTFWIQVTCLELSVSLLRVTMQTFVGEEKRVSMKIKITW